MVEKLNRVTAALSSGGIRARRGYPTEKYFFPESPVAAVNLHSADQDTVVVAAEIFAQKATDCENAAWEAMGLLTAQGASCSADGCQFQRMMGLYSLRVLARWKPEAESTAQNNDIHLYCNGAHMNYVTGFSAVSTAELYRFTAEDGTVSILRKTPMWELTVEELFPPDMAPQEEPENDFTLEIRREGGSERFPQCQWETIKRTETAEGVRQVRLAKTWERRIVNQG